MNIQKDLFNLCDVFNSSHPHKKQFGAGSCSVFIKLLPGSKELFFSHVTENRYLYILLYYTVKYIIYIIIFLDLYDYNNTIPIILLNVYCIDTKQC